MSLAGKFNFLILPNNKSFRAVAQPGSVQRSGRWGRWFESSLPDFLFLVLKKRVSIYSIETHKPN